MSERIRNLLTVTLLVVMAVGLIALVASNPSDVDRVEAIGEQIKCPVCQGESILNSPSQMARDMVDLVEERVAEGQSDQAIVDELLSSYSGAVLLDPPARGATLVLWIAPIAAVLLGAGIIVWWRRHPGEESPAAAGTSSRPRRLAPLLALGVAFAAVVVVAGFFIQDRAGPASGVADLGERDLSEVSNETMEAVIAANVENPQVDGMRLALAERYYEEGDYRSAFPHYLAVAESSAATSGEVVTALVRLGWMAWLSDAAPDDAIGLFDQALAIDPSSSTALYLKAQVLWCGDGEDEQAAQLLRSVLEDAELADDARAQVETDLDAIESGADCQ